MTPKVWWGWILILGGVLLCGTGVRGRRVVQSSHQAPPVLVEGFVMSKCPYASKFENQFNADVLQQPGLPAIVDLRLLFICNYDSDLKSNFKCMHGQDECWGNLFQLCAYNVTQGGPGNWTWFNFVECMSYRQQDIPYNAHLCALKFHLDYDALKACVFSLLGQELMYAAMHEAHRRDVRASPTVFVNGRKVSSDEYLSAVCRAYTGTPPPGCQRAVLEEGIA